MEKIAVFPGSFDPITKGHESIIRRALPLFDKVVIAIGLNSEKKAFFPLEQRITWLKEVFGDDPRIVIEQYEGLTVGFCQSINARYILRGLRTAADFEFERGIGQMNKAMVPDLETVFLLSVPEYSALSSSIVRDIYRHGGDISAFVPERMKIK
jgi:pantetheine-phosphate adenylyltransferase